MERLKEEDVHEEEEDRHDEEETEDATVRGGDSVRYPAKGKDYVILPTSDQPQNAEEEIQRKKRHKLMIAGGIIAAIVVVVVIVLCLVLLLRKPGSKGEDDGVDGDTDPLPDDSERLTCHLAGPNPTKGRCEATGCEIITVTKSDNGSTSTRCVYSKGGSYTVESKRQVGTKLEITLGRTTGPRSKRDSHSSPVSNGSIVFVNTSSSADNAPYSYNEGTVASSKLDQPLATLSEKLYVVISSDNVDTVRIKISETQTEDSDLPSGFPKANYNVTTAETGEPFYITVSRLSTDGGEVILDTKGCPLILTENFVQFGGLFGTADIFSNGKSVVSGDSLTIWNSQTSSELPYFYGSSAGGKNTAFFGVAMENSSPMKISFGEKSKDKTQVDYVMFGGDIDLCLFMGTTLKELTSQFTHTFGTPSKPPYWSLGTLVHHNPNFEDRLNSSVYKIDVLVLDTPISDPDSSQKILKTIMYVDQIVPRGIREPAIRTAEGDSFQGTINKDHFPGAYFPYVDYTYPASAFGANTGNSLYTRPEPGYNLRHNYPLNYADLECADNVVNISPFMNITDTLLYADTICLDYIHTGVDPAVKHKMVHNIYGTLQAKLLREIWLEHYLQMSDSVSLGAGKYTTKNIEIASRDDLKQLISSVVWFGYIGMHINTRLALGVDDRDLIADYHRLNGFLLLTSADERLVKLDDETLDNIKSFVVIKYLLYPEWLRLAHESKENGLPVIREMAFNYPLDTFVSSDKYKYQYMIGDKVIVAAGGLVDDKTNKTSVYLPSSRNWYRRQNNAYRRVVEPGALELETLDPSQLYFVRGGSVLVTSRLYDRNKLTNIEVVKREYVEVTIFLSKLEENIEETYYLNEGDDESQILEVHFNVTSDANGVRIRMQPGGNALEDGSQTDIRTWNKITIAGGCLQGKVSNITINDNELNGVSYTYDAVNWRESPLSIIESYDMESTPSLHESYDIMINYEE